METKNFNETARAFLITDKKNQHNESSVYKGPELAGQFERLCKAQGIPFHSTTSETKVAFAEHLIKPLKNTLHHYIENIGHKYIHKLSLHQNPESQKNFHGRLYAKFCEEIRFFSILCSNPLRKCKRIKFKIGDKVRVSKYDLLLRKSYRQQLTQKTFEFAAFPSRNTQRKKQRMNRMRLSVVN